MWFTQNRSTIHHITKTWIWKFINKDGKEVPTMKILED
jgi:hypothetical protein